MQRRFIIGLGLITCAMLMISGCGAERKARIYQESDTQAAAELLSETITTTHPEMEHESIEKQEASTSTINMPATQSPEQEPPSQYDDGWKEAYKQYLLKYMDDRDLHDRSDYGLFSLVFIDDDDIPELVVSESSSHAADANVLSYGRNGLVDHGTFGTFGQIQYLEKENIIVSDIVYQGNGTLSVHKLTPVGAKELWQGTHGYVWDENKAETVEEFQSYDKPVSSEQYNALYHQFVPDEAALKSSSDESNPYAFLLTTENVEKIDQINLR